MFFPNEEKNIKSTIVGIKIAQKLAFEEVFLEYNPAMTGGTKINVK